MSKALLQLLRDANEQIGAFLRDVAPDRGREQKAGARCPSITPLLWRLEEVGASLRGRQSDAASDPELRSEMVQYRNNLNRLKPALEIVGRRLLDRRAELESQRHRLERVGQWAAATQTTDPSSRSTSTWGVTLSD